MTGDRPAFATNRMAGATFWRIAFLALQGGGSVILFSTLAHVLSRGAFEAVAVSQGILVIVQAIGDFGLSQAAVTVLPARIVAKPEAAPSLLAGASLAYFWAAAAVLVLTLLTALIVPGAASVPVAVSAPGAAATLLVTGADGILRSQGEFRRPVVLVGVCELAGFAAVPVAAATGSATWACVAMSAGTVVGASASLAVLLRLFRAPDAHHPALASFARASLPLGLSQVFMVLGSRADTLLAGAASGLLAASTFEGSWRTYQLGQYAVGAVATASAPFLADALGAGRYEDAIQLLRKLLGGLLLIGIAVGAVLYFARHPISVVLAGSLSGPVARVLPIGALLSPVAAIGLVAFYALISQDGQRRFVLATSAIGAVINIALAAALAGGMGARGVMIGCSVGIAVGTIMLLVRLAVVLRRLEVQSSAARAGGDPAPLAHPST